MANDGAGSEDQIKRLIAHMSEPGHERLAILALAVDTDDALRQIASFNCDSPPYANVIRGVRWNDDPTFHMKNYTLACAGGFSASKRLGIKIARNPLCFGFAFMRASMASKTAGSHIDGSSRDLFPYSILARSHFGDMQFLHAMASPTDSNAQHTYERVMGWAELAYGVSIADSRFKGGRQLDSLTEVPVMRKTFKYNGWTIAYLFDNERDPMIRADIAFGALLHTVQDSFAPCHAKRDGDSRVLVKFYQYGPQNKAAHKECDMWANWLQEVPAGDVCHPVSLGRELNALRNRQAPWREVRLVLRRCLEPKDGAAKPEANDECTTPDVPAVCTPLGRAASKPPQVGAQARGG